MAVSEFVDRYLRSKRGQEDYAFKIPRVEVNDEVTVFEVLSDEVGNQLKAAGLTKGQRAGVSHVLHSVGYLVERDSEGKFVDGHWLTVGEVKNLSDEQLSKLTSLNGVRILRALLGSNTP